MGKRKTWGISLLTVGLVAAMLGPVTPAKAAAEQLTVDVSQSTGAIKHGASGFLYGLGSPGVPNPNMLAPLSPQAIAQKAPDGLQHPNGDALKVAPEFLAAGGKEIQIYMQDIYKNWPYENLGLDDYLNKIDVMVPKVVNDPNHSKFVYIPFNEPDGIWYQGLTQTGSDAQKKFFADWKTVYQRIKQLDPDAKIGGPNTAAYHAQFMHDFFNFAKANNVLPDVVTWHELNNDFFTDWYNHYNDLRSIEQQLGISTTPIAINEYARPSDLAIPGELVQWVTRLENSKVDGMLAYWTTAGTLNDLVTQNDTPTGGWWLYKWYGEMTGNTVATTPTTTNGSFQGLATVDNSKKQVRVVFGGSYPDNTYSTTINVKGLSAGTFGQSVHATVWGVDSTGTSPSSGPYVVQEGDYTVSNGQINVPLSNLQAKSAYQLIVTPATSLSTVNNAGRYEAEYAKVDGAATVDYGGRTGYSGTGYVTLPGGQQASTDYVVQVPADGYYNLDLRYSTTANNKANIVVNGEPLTSVSLLPTDTWNTESLTVFLSKGINLINYDNASGNSGSTAIDYLNVSQGNGDVGVYQAEANNNTLSGTARVEDSSAASGGKYVGWIGAGADNTLQFNDINVDQAGTYRLVVAFANAEVEGNHEYNTNIVDRISNITVNGDQTQTRYFFNTRSWSNFQTVTFDVQLKAGANTIKFSNADGYVPNIDLIKIAAPFVQGLPVVSSVVGDTYQSQN
ncbi:CBM35 domain-containing protein [Paenibacillus sp. SGZ-1009]|uniref:CBM35 domain-containing protein n=1 Tax=Paenibacillus campi TaxID=3106031 RepID=UPI002B0013EE|nr:CBM35 domain-containing protein [Paenibacillus sp. SGZ-1009]